jgi:cellulose biosynthesis protein BcsQ
MAEEGARYKKQSAISAHISLLLMEILSLYDMVFISTPAFRKKCTGIALYVSSRSPLIPSSGDTNLPPGMREEKGI